jgi:hypothetical protein
MGTAGATTNAMGAGTTADTTKHARKGKKRP